VIGPVGTVVTIRQVAYAGEAEPVDHTLTDEQTANKKSDGTGNPVVSESQSCAISYEITITATLQAGQKVQGQPQVELDGEVTAELVDCHGRVRVVAGSDGDATVGGQTATAEKHAIVGLVHEGSRLVGLGFTINSNGVQWTGQYLTAADDKEEDTYADTDLKPWADGQSAVVNVGWHGAIKCNAGLPDDPSVEEAKAIGTYRAFVLCGITFRITGPN